MDSKVLLKLEFDKIQEMLSEKALSEPGRQAALVLMPQKSAAAVKNMQCETLEAESILMREAASPMSGFSDIASEIARLKAGADLGCKELLRVLGVQKAARRAKKGISKQESGILFEMAQPLYYSDAVIKEIDDAIISDDTLADTASPELFAIRKKILRENEGIREKMSAIIRSSAHKEHLQDAIVTMRNGRYVVPVKQEYKRSLKGLVHDQSASGQTVFIEPMEVVEANNRLRELELAEAAEVERILRMF
ncbi:MAG: endonuclease MutS2, partial [Eubacteriales bacterium]|nr:endonuclease MutS2 [Eubacteriales bacterium]